jgi:hypothetical protein
MVTPEQFGKTTIDWIWEIGKSVTLAIIIGTGLWRLIYVSWQDFRKKK